MNREDLYQHNPNPSQEERMEYIAKYYRPYLYDYSRLPENRRPKAYVPRHAMIKVDSKRPEEGLR